MDMLPSNVMGIPSTFQFHSFRFVKFKEQACIRKQACRRPPRYVPYKGTFVPYDGTFSASDQGQTLDV
jgi:hypothetical protein